LWGPAQPVRTQHTQGGADESGPYAAVSRSKYESGEALHRHALCVPMQLPCSKCFRVGWGDLDFGGDDDGEVEGNAGYTDGRAGVASGIGSADSFWAELKQR
jgi:hypothetical protein